MSESATRQRVYLTETMTEAEAGVLRTWLAGQSTGSGTHPTAVAITDRTLADLSQRTDDPLLSPLRVVWMPDADRRRNVAVRLREALAPRDPLHPGRGAQRRVLRTDPSRARVIEGEPAPLSDLERRLEASGGGSLPEYIRRQAALALERAELRLLGGQYKVSRFVVDEITDTRRFTTGTLELAEKLDIPIGEVDQRTRAALEELVATQSRQAIAVWDRLGRYFSRAYRIDVDTSRFEELRTLNKEHSLVFLPSHRSYLDPLVLRPALLANGLPLNHVMGGLNVSFWPIGPISKRSGTVFIRRQFGTDEVYKWSLREYMRYLLTKRFNLEWYIEGGRGRTGKLRPPRFGLLNYLTKAFRVSGASDVYLVPVALSYDQLYEVGAMAAEAHGAEKKPEGLRWLVGYVRAQGQRNGVAHVTIGRPLSLAEALRQEDDQRLAIQKAAFEVCHRINEVTPVTASSLAMFAFLGIEDRALTVDELGFILGPLVDYVTARGLPTAGDVDLHDPRVIRKALFTHVDSGVLKRFDRGDERVYYLGKDQHLVAAFYRNNTIHFMVVRAIAELVLQAAVDDHFPDPIADGWAEAKRIRDLFKFEFFFSDRDTFEKEMRTELSLIDPGWEAGLADPRYAENMLASVRPYLAHRVLQPFAEAYQVVADELVRLPVSKQFDEKAFTAHCLDVAQQRRLRQQIASSESVSSELFATALKLARNRDLVESVDDGVRDRRASFAEEIRVLVDRLRRIRGLAHARLDLMREPTPGDLRSVPTDEPEPPAEEAGR
ncbi:glycerol-3-phosphate 1-O-acyltransferase [Rhodococcus kronopolitis]|uniref:Glycerol-3-phosphate 1-O-acyltransferase n=1 Tax=Rhodococcus kronopolitis TaxID=1460226 RepID=A0ABV9FW11_9NOCA